MASFSSSIFSSSRPTLQARQDHSEAAMATPPGSPQTWRTTNHEDNQMKAAPDRLRRQKSEILRAQYTDVRELRFSVGTRNVGGICPSIDLDIKAWLDMEEPADIYVLGFQEIIPLEAGYMIGAEDNSPVAVWERIIGETLNKKCPDKMRFKCHSASPSSLRFNPPDYALAIDDELLSQSDNDSDGELHLLNEKDSNVVINNSGVSDKTCKKLTCATNKRLQKANDFSIIPPINTFAHSQELGFEKIKIYSGRANQPNKVNQIAQSLKKAWNDLVSTAIGYACQQSSGQCKAIYDSSPSSAIGFSL
uniref:Inositol polyphosphate-related phosphatase domain-containing protein n=1 Tax=Arundo donax TaxID=35708 RepID=A0A0A9GEQ4_ARUDO